MDKARLGLLLGISMPLIAAAPLPAFAIDPCRTGMPTAYSLSEISAAGFTCQIGDKIYSDFLFTGFTGGSFIFTNPPAFPFFHTFQGQALGFGPSSSASYSYKLAVDTTMMPKNTIWKYETSTTVSSTGAGVTSTKTLQDSAIPSSLVTSVNGMNSAMYTYAPATVGPISLVSNINVTNGFLTQFTDTIIQSDVPGPLPLLGASAAFGFSRHLRRRVAKSS